MMRIDPKKVSVPKMHGYLLGSVAPRPIAFASTVDKEGNPNLAPFSFFNAFGANPPTVIFSPARRVRNNTIKHTLENIQATGEVVINSVSYSIVQQMNLASTEYPDGINEFDKSGLTPLESEVVKPFRVKESPTHLECVVKDIVETGPEGGAGNLIICEVVLMHINENILNQQQRIDPHKIDLVARMGDNYYCRASGDAVFEIEKPLAKLGVGVDQLPEPIRLSKILTGNDLGKLGNVEKLPSAEEVTAVKEDEKIRQLLQKNNPVTAIHQYAHDLLEQGKVKEAWKVLMVK